MQDIQLILHGGVTADLSLDHSRALRKLEEICDAGAKKLRTGCSALDTVEFVVFQMEDAGLYLAGRGSVPNIEGVFELDASIVDGARTRGAGVAAVPNAVSPVALARLVLDETEHSLLVGGGVRQTFSHRPDLFTETPADFYNPIIETKSPTSALGFGTVGAACVDMEGNLAAATSTCGVVNKLPGRVGDTAVIGAGTWADDTVAISCTGQGEYFLRTVAAASLASQMRFGQLDLDIAAQNTIAQITRLSGQGGLIAASRTGVTFAFNTPGLKRAWIDSNGKAVSALTA